VTKTDPAKAKTALRYWLHGKQYFSTLEAMEFASQYHTGMRKDGKTPEFHHQVSIAMYLRTLEKGLLNPQDTLTAAILHDVVEDYGVSISDIELRFGDTVSEAVALLSKEVNGVKKADADYYNGIASNPIASIVKGADRINNVQTMPGVFSAEKQRGYAEESRGLVLPMLKLARRRFPQQEAAYENIKHMLVSQLSLIDLLQPI
jgi:(p)ppGpp synthase/HD superfamily hydrolase